MPADSETSLALDIMNDEFDYDQTSSYEMMLTDVPEEEKFKIKEDIEKVEGISSVDYAEGDKYNRGEFTRYIINVDVKSEFSSSIVLNFSCSASYDGGIVTFFISL